MMKYVWIRLFAPKNGAPRDQLKTFFSLEAPLCFVLERSMAPFFSGFQRDQPGLSSLLSYISENMKTLFWSSCFVERKLCMGNVGAQRFFGQVWGTSRKIPSHPQKFACFHTYA